METCSKGNSKGVIINWVLCSIVMAMATTKFPLPLPQLSVNEPFLYVKPIRHNMHTINDMSSNQIWQWIKESSVVDQEIKKVICRCPNQNYAVIKTTLGSRLIPLDDLQRQDGFIKINEGCEIEKQTLCQKKIDLSNRNFVLFFE